MSDAPPLLLLTNDDGYQARGLCALAEALAELGEVWIVAPQQQMSGVSHAISLHRPVRAAHFAERSVWVDGTPADCIYCALGHFLPRPPTLVLSGINHGPNLGDDIFYSGTMAAAVEACLAGYSAMALSAGWQADMDVSAAAIVPLVAEALDHPMPERTLLNVNIPSTLAAAWRFCNAALGPRPYPKVVERRVDPRGADYYWIGGANLPPSGNPHSDCAIVDRGEISVSALRLDWGCRDAAQWLATWPSIA